MAISRPGRKQAIASGATAVVNTGLHSMPRVSLNDGESNQEDAEGVDGLGRVHSVIVWREMF